MTGPGPDTPDPWAVVEHHARDAVARGNDGLSAAQRLAMYVSVAPALVGATQLPVGEMGFGRAGDVRWIVQSPGGGERIAFDATGTVWTPASPMPRRVAASAVAFVAATALFLRVAGPRAIIAGLIVAAGMFALTGVLFSRWRMVGTRQGDERYGRMLEDLALRYELAARQAP